MGGLAWRFDRRFLALSLSLGCGRHRKTRVGSQAQASKNADIGSVCLFRSRNKQEVAAG